MENGGEHGKANKDLSSRKTYYPKRPAENRYQPFIYKFILSITKPIDCPFRKYFPPVNRNAIYIYIYSLSIVSNKQPCFPFSFFFFFFSIQAPHDGSMIILYWNSIDPLNVDNVEKTQSGMYDHNTQEFCTGISISFVHFSQLFLSLPLFLSLSLFLVAPSP